MNPEDLLIVALQERVRSGRDVTEGQASWHRGPYAAVSAAAVAEAESRLGLRLPALLSRLYLEVANGGFGPGYGLLGLAGGAASSHRETLESQYALMRGPDPEDAHWQWPVGLLPAFELGCGMFLCVDARSPSCAVVVFEPNPHEDGTPWSDAFFRSPHSLHVWLESWLSGAERAGQVWLDTFPGHEDG
jgi:hypothetical protein